VVKNKLLTITTQSGRAEGFPDGRPLSPATAGGCTVVSAQMVYTWIRVNDPSAGSPTETLLRLLLPLNDQV
jgi:hypothetical protein